MSVEAGRLYGPEVVTVLRVIKVAQRLGFTLDEVAELLEAGRRHPGRGGAPAGLQARAAAKLSEVDARIADLQVIRATLLAAMDTGCELMACSASPCCPLPFGELPRGNGDTR